MLLIFKLLKRGRRNTSRPAASRFDSYLRLPGQANILTSAGDIPPRKTNDGTDFKLGVSSRSPVFYSAAEKLSI